MDVVRNSTNKDNMAQITPDNKSSSIRRTFTIKNAEQKTFTGLSNVIKLLPSGNIFLLQLLNPLVTNNGKYSYTDSNGETRYGVVTKNGMILLPDSDTKSLDPVDLSAYKLRLGDFVHASLSLLVFATVAYLDPNTVKCFRPSLKPEQEKLLLVLPPLIGGIASSIFVIFPNTRHGIGFAYRRKEAQES
ncbi:hypothetical protein IFM89_006848 [Coptis chinensis]|uniref:Uncharacterized protein n=1 Tax=Coptis chinensis TaxID=261450 RepID=A0A835LQM7_9MAGN|nr:hypothetical protein IFM89_006848 [Coptis chinensis]